MTSMVRPPNCRGVWLFRFLFALSSLPCESWQKHPDPHFIASIVFGYCASQQNSLIIKRHIHKQSHIEQAYTADNERRKRNCYADKRHYIAQIKRMPHIAVRTRVAYRRRHFTCNHAADSGFSGGYPGKRLMTLTAVARITNPKAIKSGPMLCRGTRGVR